MDAREATHAHSPTSAEIVEYANQAPEFKAPLRVGFRVYNTVDVSRKLIPLQAPHRMTHFRTSNLAVRALPRWTRFY
jgi:hypothetical protein